MGLKINLPKKKKVRKKKSQNGIVFLLFYPVSLFHTLATILKTSWLPKQAQGLSVQIFFHLPSFDLHSIVAHSFSQV